MVQNNRRLSRQGRFLSLARIASSYLARGYYLAKPRELALIYPGDSFIIPPPKTGPFSG
jgi:hypothetical protein